MLHNSNNNQIHSDVIRKVLAMLDSMRHSPEDNLIFNHVALMLEEYDDKKAESEQLLCSLIALILNSLAIHLVAGSKLIIQIKLLQLRLISPITSNELVALRHYIESCADEFTQLPALTEKEIEETLEPLLSSFGLDNESPFYKMATGAKSENQNFHLGLANKTQVSKTQANKTTGNKVSLDESLQKIIASNYLLNSIAQSEKFGVLLEVELATLKNVDDEASFESRKNTVLKELENILGSHQQLTEYFQKVGEYVSGLQSDSQRLNEELDRVTLLSLTDELTGLPNRRAFEQCLEDEISRVQRYGHHLSIALLDIDHFKPINDEFGHSVGDKVLKIYAKDVLSLFRQHDMVARYGGEEFVVIFPNTDIEGSRQALEKVKQRVMQFHYVHNKQKITLPTFSAGLVGLSDNESKKEIIQRADQLLYKAKSNGRNCIEVETVLIEY